MIYKSCCLKVINTRQLKRLQKADTNRKGVTNRKFVRKFGVFKNTHLQNLLTGRIMFLKNFQLG